MSRGEKAFNGYLQGGVEEAKGKYDSTHLIAARKLPANILIDWGTADNFYKQGQLCPENFTAAARAAGFGDEQVHIRSQDADHSYYFISTFAPEHVSYHAKHLKR